MQMKPLCLYFQMVLLVFQILQNEIWEIFRIIALGRTWH